MDAAAIIDAKEQGRGTRWLSPFTAPVPAGVRGPLVRLQYDRLRRTLPFLTIAVAACAVAMAVALQGDLPAWQQYMPPAIVVLVCVALFARAARPIETDDDGEYRALSRSLFVTVPLGLIGSAWCINAFSEMEQYYCMTAPVFLGIAALVGANGLTAVPRAAIGGMAAAVLPVAIKLATYPYIGMRAMAAMLVLVAVMQGRTLLRSFNETVSLLSAQAELDRLAHSDALTGLAGRRSFMTALDARVAAGTPVLVALADLDGFKRANDLHGHNAGDIVLGAVAQRLRDTAPGAVMIARLGGDEFALLYDVGGGTLPALRELAAVSRRVAERYRVDDADIRIGISLGCATSPRDGADALSLLHHADTQMYAEKAASRADRAMTDAADAVAAATALLHRSG